MSRCIYRLRSYQLFRALSLLSQMSFFLLHSSYSSACALLKVIFPFSSVTARTILPVLVPNIHLDFNGSSFISV
nr:MAG TPA: hypothetical protein [Caudoviricetes sp.]